jgi:glycosyltransferase involved in cell wall biosynthesis
LAVKGRGFDLVHLPHYNVPLLLSSPFVVTIHDLIHFRFPEYVGRGIRTQAARFLMKQALRRARKIIAVSQATREDLSRQFQVNPEKIRVILEAAGDFSDQKFSSGDAVRVSQKFKLPSSFLLYVGNLKPHKNLPRLIQAFQSLKKEGLKEDLVLVGGWDSKAAGARDLQKLIGSEAIHWIGAVDPKELAVLYSTAKGLVLPSLWEGFGLPVLEAFQAGLPVACSRIPSHQEIVGEKGLYFDPLSTAEMRSALQKLLTDSVARKELIQLSCERLQLFSWERAARETLDLYREALS